MDDQIPHLAELHFVAEQKARHARIWEGHDQGTSSYISKPGALNSLTEPAPACPDFQENWKSVTPKLRDGYLQRARLLASSNLHEAAQGDYETFVYMLYAKCFADVDQLTVETTLSISVADFQTQLDNLKNNDLSDTYQSLAIGDEDDSDYDDSMSDDFYPLDYSLRDNEDPIIPTIEKAVEKGITALQRLQKALEGCHVSGNDNDWKPEITRLLPYAQTADVIIGVVGSTGVGKSSLINAIVDEENILATNCMRASTAVATEISYNHGDFKYKAQIEFVQRDDWKRELEILLSDVQDNREEVIKGKVPKDSEAAVAMDKIKALYPWLEPRDILTVPIETLLDHLSVGHVLGSNVVIEENNARIFSKKVKFYVDSRAKRGKKGKKVGKESRLWPLIRVVRVFVKAEALSTGAVLVDLPGIFDSNSARVAVAEEYMKRCAAHWIVTPINRAVDDKVARDLLGRNFKMQMQMDSAFNDITFICTKTDDISVREVQESLKLDLPMQKQRDANLARMQAALHELRARKARHAEELENLNEELDELELRLGEGEQPIDVSLLSPTKRKHREVGSGSMPNSSGTHLSPLTAENPVIIDSELPAATQQLLSQYHNLKTRRKTLHAQRKPLNEEIRQKEKEIEEFKEESDSTKAANIRQCVKARSEFSKQEIKRDFVQGILDTDEECHSEENENFGKEDDSELKRDYEALERDLPVFCVSTRAYQKLRGRLRKEPVVEGFEHLDETEIPQLQRHCILLTEKARKSSAFRFLTNLQQTLQSMSLWSSTTSAAKIIQDGKTREMEATFNKAFSGLSSKFNDLKTDFRHISDILIEQNILGKMDTAIKSAVEGFPRMVNKWNAKRIDGGIAFQTYRATCKRNGMFREKNWNDDLANPMLKTIMDGWKKYFEYSGPIHRQHLTEDLVNCLHQCHKNVIRSCGDGISEKNRKKLATSVETYCATLQTSIEEVGKSVKSTQKEISRLFPQVISNELGKTYKACAEQRGLGTLKRMQELMIQQAKDAEQVFESCANKLRECLLELQKDTRKEIEKIATKTVSDMKRDYYTVIIEPKVRKFSDEQIKIRNKVHRIIQETQAELQLDELLKRKEIGRHRAASEETVKAEPTEDAQTGTTQEVGVAIKMELDDENAQA